MGQSNGISFTDIPSHVALLHLGEKKTEQNQNIWPAIFDLFTPLRTAHDGLEWESNLNNRNMVQGFIPDDLKYFSCWSWLSGRQKPRNRDPRYLMAMPNIMRSPHTTSIENHLDFGLYIPLKYR